MNKTLLQVLPIVFWLGFARVVLEAFPGSFSARRRATLVGNPVRAAIATLPAPEQRLAARSGPLRVLVLGGSLGARSLNTHVPAGLALAAMGRPVEVRHQTGRGGIDDVAAAYRSAQLDATVTPYIEDMAAAYAWADLAVCRGGALTLAELAAAGVPAVVVPFPHAVDDHQRANAAQLVAAGAALIVDDAALSAATVAAAVHELGLARAELAPRATAARSLALPDATRDIAAICRAEAEGPA